MEERGVWVDPKGQSMGWEEEEMGRGEKSQPAWMAFPSFTSEGPAGTEENAGPCLPSSWLSWEKHCLGPAEGGLGQGMGWGRKPAPRWWLGLALGMKWARHLLWGHRPAHRPRASPSSCPFPPACRPWGLGGSGQAAVGGGGFPVFGQDLTWTFFFFLSFGGCLGRWVWSLQTGVWTWF